jgi:hypothetical protein
MTPTTDDLRCKYCHKKALVYRNVEVTGTGWVDVKLGINAYDEITAELLSGVQDVEYDVTHPLEWGCAHCGRERSDLDDLLELDNLDPIRWVQKHPPEGQLVLGLA